MSLSDKGFTLVEVLIAAVIVFSALSVGMLVYRTSLIAVDRIEANVVIADALPAIMAAVKTQIAERKRQGQGNFGSAVEYSWKTKEVKSSRNYRTGFVDETTGQLEYGRFLVVLNNVELTITYERNGRRRQAAYEYQELSWSG
jgi:prepilin-type N-terminal cleavage/methylation domain-containing protein